MAGIGGTAATDEAPLVWALLGAKAGDNAQVLALARALGFPFVEKRLALRRLRWLPNWLVGATALAADPASRSVLVPPWPDAVIAIGQRSVPVARWIRRRSGGRARLVHVGRPRAPLRWFDLVVTTPQYEVPSRPNVMRLDLPFPTQTREALDRAAAAWRTKLAPGRLRVALLVGGDTQPWRFDAGAIDALAAGAMRLCDERAASLLVTCGRRLAPAARERLRELTRPRAEIFHGVGDPGDNPYLAFLALADVFVATTDSVSMVAEALATGREVRLFDPTFAPSRKWRIRNGISNLVRRLAPAPVFDALLAGGVVSPKRRTGRVAEHLVRAGLASYLGDAPPRVGTDRPAEAPGVAAVLDRVRALLRAPAAALPHTESIR